jgi:hypothetical protein
VHGGRRDAIKSACRDKGPALGARPRDLTTFFSRQSGPGPARARFGIGRDRRRVLSPVTGIFAIAAPFSEGRLTDPTADLPAGDGGGSPCPVAAVNEYPSGRIRPRTERPLAPPGRGFRVVRGAGPCVLPARVGRSAARHRSAIPRGELSGYAVLRRSIRRAVTGAYRTGGGFVGEHPWHNQP